MSTQDNETKKGIIDKALAGSTCMDAYIALWPESAPIDLGVFQTVWNAIASSPCWSEVVAKNLSERKIDRRISPEELYNSLEANSFHLLHARKLVLDSARQLAVSQGKECGNWIELDEGLAALNSAISRLLREQFEEQNSTFHSYAVQYRIPLRR